LYHIACSCLAKSGDYLQGTLAAHREKMCMALFFYIFFGCARLDLDNMLLQGQDVFGILLVLIYSVVKKHRLNSLSKNEFRVSKN
jgi:hypothetical protein